MEFAPSKILNAYSGRKLFIYVLIERSHEVTINPQIYLSILRMTCASRVFRVPVTLIRTLGNSFSSRSLTTCLLTNDIFVYALIFPRESMELWRSLPVWQYLYEIRLSSFGFKLPFIRQSRTCICPLFLYSTAVADTNVPPVTPHIRQLRT